MKRFTVHNGENSFAVTLTRCRPSVEDEEILVDTGFGCALVLALPTCIAPFRSWPLFPGLLFICIFSSLVSGMSRDVQIPNTAFNVRVQVRLDKQAFRADRLRLPYLVAVSLVRALLASHPDLTGEDPPFLQMEVDSLWIDLDGSMVRVRPSAPAPAPAASHASAAEAADLLAPVPLPVVPLRLRPSFRSFVTTTVGHASALRHRNPAKWVADGLNATFVDGVLQLHNAFVVGDEECSAEDLIDEVVSALSMPEMEEAIRARLLVVIEKDLEKRKKDKEREEKEKELQEKDEKEEIF